MTNDEVIFDGFPDDLESTVRGVASLLGEPFHPSRSGDEVVLAHGTTITIPARVYVTTPPAEVIESLDVVELTVARCLLARHHDGFVRQRQIGDLVSLSEPWERPVRSGAPGGVRIRDSPVACGDSAPGAWGTD